MRAAAARLLALRRLGRLALDGVAAACGKASIAEGHAIRQAKPVALVRLSVPEQRRVHGDDKGAVPALLGFRDHSTHKLAVPAWRLGRADESRQQKRGWAGDGQAPAS